MYKKIFAGKFFFLCAVIKCQFMNVGVKQVQEPSYLPHVPSLLEIARTHNLNIQLLCREKIYWQNLFIYFEIFFSLQKPH